MFIDITLHQLRVFQAVAQHRSYSRAAASLFLSQPAVSVQMRALEQAVGQPLVEKAGRTVTLTEAGRIVLGYSERITALLNDAHLALDELSGGQRGAVKIGASTSAGIYVVPTALGAFHRHYPLVELSLDVVNRFTAQQRLLANEIDLAVMGLIEDTRDLEVAEFMPNELVVIAAPSHPLSGRTAISLVELSREPILLREAQSGTRVDTERIFAAHGAPLRVGMELRSSGATKQAVAAGLGIAIIPLAAIRLELRVGQLIVLDVAGFPIRRSWSLVRLAGRQRSAAAAALWDFLRAYRDAAARPGNRAGESSSERPHRL